MFLDTTGAAPLQTFLPMFETVPPDLVVGIVTERGLLGPSDMPAIVAELEKLADWS